MANWLAKHSLVPIWIGDSNLLRRNGDIDYFNRGNEDTEKVYVWWTETTFNAFLLRWAFGNIYY